MIELRLGKSTKTSIGSKRKESSKKQAIKCKTKRLKHRSRTSKRGREAKLFLLVRALVVQEYEMEYGQGYCEGKECDHIKGRNAEGFKLGAMLDPQNLQMLTPEEHHAKTNGQHIDYRFIDIKARLVKLSEKILKAMPEVWNLDDLRLVLINLQPEEPF